MTEYEALLRVGLAAVLGGVVGFEREAQDRPAGFRTHVLVALGAALFTVVGVLIVELPEFSDLDLDPTRVLEGIIGGIGFLGGALVFRQEDRASGLTTAAGIWAVTGVGIATGLGYYILAVGATVLIVGVLYLLLHGERLIGIR